MSARCTSSRRSSTRLRPAREDRDHGPARVDGDALPVDAAGSDAPVAEPPLVARSPRRARTVVGVARCGVRAERVDPVARDDAAPALGHQRAEPRVVAQRGAEAAADRARPGRVDRELARPARRPIGAHSASRDHLRQRLPRRRAPPRARAGPCSAWRSASARRVTSRPARSSAGTRGSCPGRRGSADATRRRRRRPRTPRSPRRSRSPRSCPAGAGRSRPRSRCRATSGTNSVTSAAGSTPTMPAVSPTTDLPTDCERCSDVSSISPP